MSVVHAPVSLFPTPFPQKAFQRVQNVMPELSKLVHAVSEDMEYVNETLSTAAQFDSFTKSLLDVHSKTAEARAQNGSPIALGLHRSDYMLDEPSGNLLQVLIRCPMRWLRTVVRTAYRIRASYHLYQSQTGQNLANLSLSHVSF